jgi:hypothetical protein
MELKDEKQERLNKLTTHALLHTLWTKAVGSDSYDKAEWGELDKRLTQAKMMDPKEKR